MGRNSHQKKATLPDPNQKMIYFNFEIMLSMKDWDVKYNMITISVAR